MEPLIMTATDPKPLLRQEMKRRRTALATANPFAGDQLAQAAVAELDARALWPAKGSLIAGYWPIQSEINPFPLLQAFEDRGYPLALPCLVPAGAPPAASASSLPMNGAGEYAMVFRRFRIGDPLIAGPFDILQPPEGDSATPDVVLMPLLAFDRRGVRLGYGGGYYDRVLGAMRARRRVAAWGIAFSAQQLAEIPFEAHDERLDVVITETGLSGVAPQD